MLVAVVSLLLAAAQAPPAPDSLGADWSPSTKGVHDQRKAGRIVPLGQAIAAVQARVAGRLLDAGLESGAGGRSVYRVRWAAADGRRLDVIVDAETGAVIRQEGG